MRATNLKEPKYQVVLLRKKGEGYYNVWVYMTKDLVSGEFFYLI
ncbi:hypothetical protein NYE76_10065 [Paenibacillus sp. FSL M7-0831]|nr:hypothetical protein [Paenibacillus macerans]MEC0330982.1 hypothetical protein [Paenibacillus macerans]